MAGHPTRHGDTWRIRWVDANGIRRSEVYAERRDAVLRLAQHRLEATEIRRGLRAAPTIDSVLPASVREIAVAQGVACHPKWRLAHATKRQIRGPGGDGDGQARYRGMAVDAHETLSAA